MRFGVTLPNLGVGDDPRVIVELAKDAEDAGWEGVFVWDAPGADDVEGAHVTFDAWELMTAIALETNRVLIGPMITPLPWHRPWEVARRSVSLDRISGGRFVLCVGLGWVPPHGSPFSEETDRKIRAKRLDEGLEIIERCWSGERFSYEGSEYQLKDVRFVPKPIGKIPVWVVGAWHADRNAWPKKRSMRRALRWDGVLPDTFSAGGERSGEITFDTGPDVLRDMADWISSERTEPIDIVCEGGGDREDVNADAETVRGWRDAGATWWLEAVWWSMYRHVGDPGPMRERIRQGPPKL
jgi:luciferase-like monooxygenase